MESYFDTKYQFLDPKLVGFGGLNVKIGAELTKLWLFLIFKQIPIHFFARARARDISREFPALIPGNGKWRGPGIPGTKRYLWYCRVPPSSMRSVEVLH